MSGSKGEVLDARYYHASGQERRITPEMWSDILMMIEEGHTIRSISAMADVAGWSAIRRFIRESEEARTQYARAREIAAEAYEAQILDIAEKTSPLDAPASKIKIDALKWIMSKRAPKVYGDKITQEVTGADGGPLQVAAVRRVIVDRSPGE